MNIYIAWTVTVLGWLCWPLANLAYYLTFSIVFLLKLLYRPLAFLLGPVIYLGRFVLLCLAFPLYLLAKLEPLYNFLGVAALVGVIVGLAIAYIYRTFHDILKLDREPSPSAKPVRTVREYRQAKAKQKINMVHPSPLSPSGYVSASDGFANVSRARNAGLLAQTILEEADSDY